MNEIDNEKHTADYMGMSVSWLRHSRGRGNGPEFLKLGRAVRYQKAAVERFLAEKKATNTIYRHF